MKHKTVQLEDVTPAEFDTWLKRLAHRTGYTLNARSDGHSVMSPGGVKVFEIDRLKLGRYLQVESASINAEFRMHTVEDKTFRMSVGGFMESYRQAMVTDFGVDPIDPVQALLFSLDSEHDSDGLPLVEQVDLQTTDEQQATQNTGSKISIEIPTDVVHFKTIFAYKLQRMPTPWGLVSELDEGEVDGVTYLGIKTLDGEKRPPRAYPVNLELLEPEHNRMSVTIYAMQDYTGFAENLKRMIAETWPSAVDGRQEQPGNRSGGIDNSANQINVGQDMVGGSKVVFNNYNTNISAGVRQGNPSSGADSQVELSDAEKRIVQRGERVTSKRIKIEEQKMEAERLSNAGLSDAIIAERMNLDIDTVRRRLGKKK